MATTSKFTNKQIKAFIRANDKGTSVPDLAEKHGFGVSTFSNWKKNLAEGREPRTKLSNKRKAPKKAKRKSPKKTTRQYTKRKMNGHNTEIVKDLAAENTSLKVIIVDMMLENQAMKENQLTS